MSDIIRVLTRPAFWVIAAVFALITIPHYAEAVIQPPFVGDILSYLNLSRHGFERILFLVPVVLAGFLFVGGGTACGIEERIGRHDDQ